MDIYYAVYSIRHKPSGMQYIGRSSCVEFRWRQHKNLLRSGKHNSPLLQDYWNRDGENAFEFLILEMTNGRENMDKERYYLQKRYIEKGSHEFNTTPSQAKIMALSDEYLPVKQACAVLHVLPYKMAELLKSGVIPYVLHPALHNVKLIKRADLEKYQQARKALNAT